MSSWIRKILNGIGLTQAPPGEHPSELRQPSGTVLLCIDVSNSMAGKPLRQAVKGGEKFLRDAVDAHYRCGLVLWNHKVDCYVPPRARHSRVLNTLRHAQSRGGTDLVPTLRLAKRLFGSVSGDRLLCVFGDGDIGNRRKAVRLARRLCAMGVRIDVRGRGARAAANLECLLCPGEAVEANRVIKDVSSIDSGIASMTAGLGAIRRMQ